MKYLLLLLLLGGCVKFDGPMPWKQPDNATISCNGDTCCYPSHPGIMECVQSKPFNGTVIVFVKVIEK